MSRPSSMPKGVFRRAQINDARVRAAYISRISHGSWLWPALAKIGSAHRRRRAEIDEKRKATP